MIAAANVINHRFKSCGKPFKMFPFTKIINQEAIDIGHHCQIDDFVFIDGGYLTVIGDYVHMATFVSVTGGGVLVVGSFTTLSSGCRIFTGTDNFDGSTLCGAPVPAPFREPWRGRVSIGDHVLIGANAVVLPGAEIHDGVVIAAGAVVLQDQTCFPWGVYAGAPAKWAKARPRERMLELEGRLRAKEG